MELARPWHVTKYLNVFAKKKKIILNHCSALESHDKDLLFSIKTNLFHFDKAVLQQMKNSLCFEWNFRPQSEVKFQPSTTFSHNPGARRSQKSSSKNINHVWRNFFISV